MEGQAQQGEMPVELWEMVGVIMLFEAHVV